MGILELLMLNKQIHSVKAVLKRGEDGKQISRENKDCYFSNKIKTKNPLYIEEYEK